MALSAVPNRNIRTLYVGIHLGNPPAFEIRADESLTATPIDCHFMGQGAGKQDLDFLLEILHKIEAAYRNSTALSLCLQGIQIKRDAQC